MIVAISSDCANSPRLVASSPMSPWLEIMSLIAANTRPGLGKNAGASIHASRMITVHSPASIQYALRGTHWLGRSAGPREAIGESA